MKDSLPDTEPVFMREPVSAPPPETQGERIPDRTWISGAETVCERKRCEVCDWPLVETMEDGCIEGNCSYRPHEGTTEYFKIRKRREELAARKAGCTPTRTPETQGERRLEDLKALYREAVRQNSHLPSVAWQKVIELIEHIARLEGGPLDGPETQGVPIPEKWKPVYERHAALLDTDSLHICMLAEELGQAEARGRAVLGLLRVKHPSDVTQAEEIIDEGGR